MGRNQPAVHDEMRALARGAEAQNLFGWTRGRGEEKAREDRADVICVSGSDNAYVKSPGERIDERIWVLAR